jgi:potassium channel subfamily K, other eukaryote
MVCLAAECRSMLVLTWRTRLVGLNAVSLLFGVAANVSIFLGVDVDGGAMSNHTLSFVAVTIIGGNVASFILIALIVAAHFELGRAFSPGHAFTGAFYFAIMAAVLYSITSTFVVYTAYMIRSRRQVDQGASRIPLAKGHRKLMILTAFFMSYILLGAVVFSHVEGWGYLDTVYWADVTLLTVGFGDFKPSTHLGRSLLFPYATCGVIVLFLIIYCITNLVFSRGKSMWEIYLRDRERIKRVRQRKKEEGEKKVAFYARLWRDKAAKGNPNAARRRDATRVVNAFKSRSKVVKKNEEREERKKDFKRMRRVLRLSARKRLWYSIVIWGSCWMLLWLAGAAVFFISERPQGWSYFEAVYFAFVALLAIGYGDFTLQSNSAKAFFVLWSLVAVPTLTMLITTTVEALGSPYLVMQRDCLIRKIRGKPPKEKERLLGGLLREQALENFWADRWT